MKKIKKLEAAQRNLKAAIRLFFEERDAVAVHTLAAAAQGVLRDIARSRNLDHTSILHDHPHVDQEVRREWINALNAPRNFFKHADKDPEGSLEFDEHENVLVLLDAVLILFELHAHIQEAGVFIGWFTTANPKMRSAISGNQIGDYCVRNNIRPDEMGRFLEMLDSRILIEPI